MSILVLNPLKHSILICVRFWVEYNLDLRVIVLCLTHHTGVLFARTAMENKQRLTSRYPISMNQDLKSCLTFIPSALVSFDPYTPCPFCVVAPTTQKLKGYRGLIHVCNLWQVITAYITAKANPRASVNEHRVERLRIPSIEPKPWKHLVFKVFGGMLSLFGGSPYRNTISSTKALEPAIGELEACIYPSGFGISNHPFWI